MNFTEQLIIIIFQAVVIPLGIGYLIIISFLSDFQWKKPKFNKQEFDK